MNTPVLCYPLFLHSPFQILWQTQMKPYHDIRSGEYKLSGVYHNISVPAKPTILAQWYARSFPININITFILYARCNNECPFSKERVDLRTKYDLGDTLFILGISWRTASSNYGRVWFMNGKYLCGAKDYLKVFIPQMKQ